MKYISTRGRTEPLSFEDAVMTGLAPDGGLLLPESVPDVRDRLAAWSDLSYRALALEVFALFTNMDRERLQPLVERSYATFRAREVVPIRAVDDVFVAELFHGPTLAFKDIALQFLGRLFEQLLAEQGAEMNILVATSGDTGSAAIHGVRGRKGIRIFVMHPHRRVSALQERQMTSVLDDNVFNLAVKGTFDDCQGILKEVFGDLDFKHRYVLGAVNSINWARVLAQIVYYFYAAFEVMKRTGASRVRFAVPTGNFGDILSGYFAARMGLPVGALVLATNENDILRRFFDTGEYKRGAVHSTLSPSMDIQVASNFERYLYYRTGEDPVKLRALMSQFAEGGALQMAPLPSGRIDERMVAGTGDRATTLDTIRAIHEQEGYLLDPHTAVGVSVARRHLRTGEPMICLATAHPAKFPAAIREATGQDIARHPLLQSLAELPTRSDVLPAEAAVVREYISAHVPGKDGQ